MPASEKLEEYTADRLRDATLAALQVSILDI